MSMSKEEREAFRETAASFAKRSVAPILEHESADGDLERVGAILDEAYATGLMASPDPEAPGHDAGVWGRDTLDQGPRVSLTLLEELSVACGGVAMNAHAAGLGALMVAMAESAPAGTPQRVAVALSEGGFPPGADVILKPSLNAPARIETVAVKTGDGYTLSGRKDFVYQALGVEAYVAFARMDDEWAAFLVPAGASGLAVEELGSRMGLRACPIVNLEFSDVAVSEEFRLRFGVPVHDVVMEYLRLWNLGLVAIGAGVARGALAAARQYAEDRYQGCTEIINHPGMGALLADSESRIMVCLGLLDRASEAGVASAGLLAAAKARLAGMAAAAGAVTDSLQIFGGYGYMEDYRMEKRYRDVNTLKCSGGSPRDLRALIAGLSREA